MTEETEPYWAAANEGRLIVERCTACGAESHPPRGICRQCRGREMEWTQITEDGVVYSYTVNHQRWLPTMEVPFAVVLVEWETHPGVRVVGRIRGCAPEDVRIGMRVAVGFEEGPGEQNVPSFVAIDPAVTA
jgi:uncharacterized OB-fold protein